MNDVIQLAETDRYARCIEGSKAVRWDIEKDVIQGRAFDATQKYLPDGLSLVQEMTTLSDAERRFASQIQGRTYANMFAVVERFITAKLLDISRDHSLGDQNALEALVRFSDEEIKHQLLFRRIDTMMGKTLPAGYRFDVDPDAVARTVLDRSTWSVLVLTLYIELLVLQHYRESIEPDAALSALFRDVFRFHWKEESQHVVLDELEARRHDATLGDEQRDRGVDDLIALVQAIDGIVRMQARSDADYFVATCGRAVPGPEADRLANQFHKAYRWQYILSGAGHPRFQVILGSMVTALQAGRIEAALAALR